MFYNIMTYKEARGKVFASSKFFHKQIFVRKDSIVLSAGKRQVSVKIVLKKDLNENELMISQDVMEELLLPTDVKYQVKVDKDCIKVGPVIGLLMTKNAEGLTKGALKELLNYCLIYPQINGLIIAFSLDDIDFEGQKVKGYYYNPSLKANDGGWKEGVFPFPDSIFQRMYIPEDMRHKLKENTNNCIFNSNYFNKWDFYSMISKFETFCPYIPETHTMSSIDDVDPLLSIHGAVYLKPAAGTLSRGIYKVTTSKGLYDIKDKQGQLVLQSSSREEAGEFIKGLARRHRYLVQQSLSPIKFEDRHLDFRVIMQKDHTMIWKCTAIIAFVGGQGDICTNWGYTQSFEDLMAEKFNLSQQEIYRKKQEVIAACSSVCKILDMTGDNYGDLGLDVLIDESKKVWILEANKKHYHQVALWNDDSQTYYDIKANIMKYAAALKGFDVY